MLFCQKCRFNKFGGCTIYPEGTAEVERMNYCNYFDEEVIFPEEGRLTSAPFGELGLNGGDVVDARAYPQLQAESEPETIDVEQLHASVVKIERLLREVMESRGK